jgi:hypothetical protein
VEDGQEKRRIRSGRITEFFRSAKDHINAWKRVCGQLPSPALVCAGITFKVRHNQEINIAPSMVCAFSIGTEYNDPLRSERAHQTIDRSLHEWRQFQWLHCQLT